MNNKELRDNFRRQLTNTHALTVATVSLIEIIGYIILIHSGVETFALSNKYLWYGVVAPIFINLTAHIVARVIINRENVKRRFKNATIIGAALITSFVVAVIHKEYIVTGCAFVFPMVLSSAFNDKKLLNTSFWCSLFIIVCVGVAFWIDKAINLHTALNLFVLFGFAVVSYFCSRISIDFSSLNYTIIETQAETNDKLLQDVLKDQMTGLYNHNTFVNRLGDFANNSDDKNTICLAMLDVDDFKGINDTYGHDCGDDVLIYIAKTIKKHCSDVDCGYRYGGEEFAIIFQQKDTTEVYSTIKKILDEFSAHKFDFTDKKITFSAGISKYEVGVTGDEFFELADKTLYKAKKEGKNRILIA